MEDIHWKQDTGNYRVYARWRNKVKMKKQSKESDAKEISKCVQTHPEKFRNYGNKSTEAIAALKLADGTCAGIDNDKAATLNNFFSSVSTNETLGDWDVVKRHVNRISDDLSFTTEIVSKELTGLDTTKSMGPDNLHPRILYQKRYKIASTSSSIFHTSCDFGKIPSDWKCANLSAIHKKDSRSDVNNRPFSLRPICRKIVEQM